ncbi:hypothetical protein ACLBYA_26775 [Mycobacterium sp. C31M]
MYANTFDDSYVIPRNPTLEAARGGMYGTDGNRLCVRRSTVYRDRSEFPEVVRDYLERFDLEVVGEFTEDDEYMIGGEAVVTVYRLTAVAVAELAA